MITDAFLTSDINFGMLQTLWCIRSSSMLTLNSVVKNHSKKSESESESESESDLSSQINNFNYIIVLKHLKARQNSLPL